MKPENLKSVIFFCLSFAFFLPDKYFQWFCVSEWIFCFKNTLNNLNYCTVGFRSFYQVDTSKYIIPNPLAGPTLSWTTSDSTMDRESGSTTMEQKWRVTPPRLRMGFQLETVELLSEDTEQTETITMATRRLMNWSSSIKLWARMKSLCCIMGLKLWDKHFWETQITNLLILTRELLYKLYSIPAIIV